MKDKESFFKFMKEIENEEICKKCREKRKEFKKYDLKSREEYCPPLPGCWSYSNKTEYPPNPLDVMIIAESHGGGDWSEYVNKNAKERVNLNYYYHKIKRPESFFQYKIRKIIDEIDNMKKIWYFTDLVKCYVFKNKKKDKNTNIIFRGSRNFNTAITECKYFLKKQIEILNPFVILVLGKRAQEVIMSLNIDQNKVINYPFPGPWTADSWAKMGGYEQVIKDLKNKLNNNNNKVHK